MNIKETLQFIFNSFKFWFIVNPWEEAIRVRFGKHQKLWKTGFYFKIPYFDRIYSEAIRLRIVSMPLQSITTRDGKVLSIKGAVGYKIVNLMDMYNNIHQPETTIINIALDTICDYVKSHRYEDMDVDELKKIVLSNLNEFDYGIEFDSLNLSSICEVKTFRLIQDQHWEHEGLDLDEVV